MNYPKKRAMEFQTEWERKHQKEYAEKFDKIVERVTKVDERINFKWNNETIEATIVTINGS